MIRHGRLFSTPPDWSAAAHSVNALGLDLLARGTGSKGNALWSPYSIQSALAMTFAGADGDTRAEMAKALRFPANEAELHGGFAALQEALAEVQRSTAEHAANGKRWGGSGDSIVLTIANRLFGQQGYEFREAFLEITRDNYGAPLQPMDFSRDPSGARKHMNAWVESETRRRIRDLIPRDGVGHDTRLVQVNAIYLKAPWESEFSERETKPRPFHIGGGAPVEVPTMFRQAHFGYARADGFSVVAIPYLGGDVQLLVLLPDTPDGLAVLEAKVTAESLASYRNPGSSELELYLPRFKMEPPVMELSQALRSLGMVQAFDVPKGSANFERMAPRKPADYLFISEVFHKTFLALDEKGTEAAAATAIAARAGSAAYEMPKPIEVRVDRPFLFAIQHRPSGACLFLGRVTDPR